MIVLLFPVIFSLIIYLPKRSLQNKIRNNFVANDKSVLTRFVFLAITFLFITILSDFILHFDSVTVDRSGGETGIHSMNIGEVIVRDMMKNTERLSPIYSTVALILQFFSGSIFGYITSKSIYNKLLANQKKDANIILFIFFLSFSISWVFMQVSYYGFLSIVEYPVIFLRYFTVISMHSALAVYFITMLQKINFVSKKI